MLRDLYQFKQVAGIAIHIDTDGTYIIDGCLLSIDKQRLSFEKKNSGLKSIDELKKHLPAKTIVGVNLTGKGILTKQVSHLTDVNTTNFNQILPNANLDDFYTQVVGSADASFVSVIRKADADKWFDDLSMVGFYPVQLSLGPFPIMNIIDQTNIYGEEIVFLGHIIQRDVSKQWVKYRYSESARSEYKIKIQSEVIEENLLLPYANAFQLLLNHQIDTISAKASVYENSLTEKTIIHKNKINMMMLLFGFFAVLLINFCLFSWLESSNDEFSNRLSRTTQNSNLLKVNTDQIKQKEATLKALGWDDNRNKAKLVDQLVAIMPGEVRCTAITVNPVNPTASQQLKTLVFSNNFIKITGLSAKLLSVNEWMARLKTKPWVKSIQLEDYNYNNELNTGAFTLTITY